jgi:hypothetical protein
MTRPDSVLYVGSGLSATSAGALRDKVTLCCAVNNAWRVFAPRGVDYWLHPGDFPPEKFPPEDFPHTCVGYSDFRNSARDVFARLGEVYPSPQHHAGYTTFFQGFYWLLDQIQPQRIFTLGFDHDYDQTKVARWESGGLPSPLNKYCGTHPPSIDQWSNEFFKGCPADAFYGHGTPDPLRLGEQTIRNLFSRAQNSANRLGVEVFNVSGVTHGLNSFQQHQL